jgi:hypothetical protein
MKLNHIYNDFLYEGLDKKSIRSVRLWEHAGIVIKEAELTADQITQLFQQIEAGATASGSNRTMVGKGKDVATVVNKAWEDLKTKVQNSGPIKDIDAKYDQAAEKLKQATGGDQGVMQYIQKYRDFAKAHPIAQSLIYSALIAAAGISGVGIGGAAALGLLKMTDKLLQGEKFSSAAYSGAKTGATAYAAGQIGQAMKGTPDTNIPTDATSVGAQGITGDMTYDQAVNTYIQKFAQDPKNPSAMIIQQAKQFAASKVNANGLSESTIAALFTLVQIKNRQFNEGMWDTIKNKAATIGKNLTTKITADKLNSAWKKAGSPTDSDAVANILRQAGVDDTVISKVFGDMQITVTPAASVSPNNQKVNIDEIAARIKKLSAADQQRVIAALGTA